MNKTERIKELEKGCGEHHGSLGSPICEKDNLCDDCELKLNTTKQTLKEVGEIVDKLDDEDMEPIIEFKEKLRKELGLEKK